MPTKLYRGDSILNNPLLSNYRSAGLLTGLANGGNPAYVKTRGILESVRSHVKPINEREEYFQQHSHFFSFSGNKDVAAFYASYKQPNELVLIPSDDYSETRYIFTLNVEDMVLLEKQKGLYSIEYSCDSSLICSDSPTDKSIGYDPLTAMYNSFEHHCEGCSDKKFKHTLLVIDVVAFLQTVPSASRYSDSLKNAQNDSEWLVMPTDYIPSLVGNSARIPRSQIWFAEHYRLHFESPRNQ